MRHTTPQVEPSELIILRIVISRQISCNRFASIFVDVISRHFLAKPDVPPLLNCELLSIVHHIAR